MMKLSSCPYMKKAKNQDGKICCARGLLFTKGCPYSLEMGVGKPIFCSGKILTLRKKHRKMWEKMNKIQKKYGIYSELLYHTNEIKKFYRFRSGTPSRMNEIFLNRAINIIKLFRKELETKRLKKTERKETDGFKEIKTAILKTRESGILDKSNIRFDR